jgi:hypothetical protein
LPKGWGPRHDRYSPLLERQEDKAKIADDHDQGARRTAEDHGPVLRQEASAASSKQAEAPCCDQAGGVMTAIERTVGDMFAAEWIHSPEIASKRDGAARPSTKQLVAARLFILSRDDVFTEAQRATADTWRPPQ